RFSGFRALINVIRLLDRRLVVDNCSHGADHAGRAVRLKNISAHIHADGAAAHRVERELERLELGSLFAAGDNHGNRTTLHELVEIVTVIGFHNVRAELGGDAAGKTQIAHVARHVFPYRRDREHRDAVALALVDEFGEAYERLLFELRAD